MLWQVYEGFLIDQGGFPANQDPRIRLSKPLRGKQGEFAFQLDASTLSTCGPPDGACLYNMQTIFSTPVINFSEMNKSKGK